MPIDLSNAAWRKSSYTAQQGDCVELADVEEIVAVRDSKDPNGPKLIFPRGAFAKFTASVKAGVHDR
ncbi:MAG: DUF397 domain-containing protein [Actinomadura sp.]